MIPTSLPYLINSKGSINRTGSIQLFEGQLTSLLTYLKGFHREIPSSKNSINEMNATLQSYELILKILLEGADPSYFTPEMCEIANEIRTLFQIVEPLRKHAEERMRGSNLFARNTI
jgi:hypothetical protein